MFNTRRLVFLSVLIAMGTVLHVVEGMVPVPLPIPGVKLGLANMVTLIALHSYGARDGVTVAVARVLLGSLIGGVFLSPGFLLSLTGAVSSTLIMALLLKYSDCFSVIGISMAGAVGHNMGQLLAAFLLLQNKSIFFYLPVLLMAGIPTGLFTGYILKSLLERVERLGILRIYEDDAASRNLGPMGLMKEKNLL
ncbi:MAG: Gx transporter family protein [Geobacteraceae bacterium]|nr:Gx transporter family protein [Geobacteraceae bacterium]